MSSFHHARSAAAAATLAACVATGPAAAFEVGPTIPVSKPTSPFTGCTADAPAKQTGTVYPNTEIEPFLDSAPRSPRVLIAGWQQDRWSNGGARGNAAAYSSNYGLSWRTVVPPGISKCSGGPYDRASDPWVTISPNGTAYFMSLAFDNDLPDGRFGANAMLVNRSTTNGATWSAPITLTVDGVGQALNDKNAMTADTRNARYVYAAWDRIVDYSLPTGLDAGGGRGARLRAIFLRDQAKAKTAAKADEVFYEGPTFLVRTTNGGVSWEAPKKVFDPGPNAQTINNLIEVSPRGEVNLFFDHITSEGRAFIEVMRSTDRAKTFGKPVRIAEINLNQTGAVTPDGAQAIRDASILFDTAVDPRNGRLYVAWQDVRFTGMEAIAFSRSLDGGKTWSKPIRIDRTPANKTVPRRGQAFLPSIDVGPRGDVIVTYYDFRNDDASGELADVWAVRCRSNCDVRRYWSAERRLTAKSIDYAKAPVARGLFLGDYMGLEVAGLVAYPLFGVTTAAANSADLVTRPIWLP